MIGKNNLKKQYERQAEKVETYSIKKFKAGAVSVLIGVGLFFGAGAAEASDSSVQTNGNNKVDNSKELNASTETSVEVKPVEKKIENTREKVAEAVAEKLNSQTSKKEQDSEKTQQEADKTLLLQKIEELKVQLERIKNNSKQQSIIDEATKKLESVEVLIENNPTQVEVDKKVREISSYVAILKSIKAEVKDDNKIEISKQEVDNSKEKSVEKSINSEELKKVTEELSKAVFNARGLTSADDRKVVEEAKTVIKDANASLDNSSLTKAELDDLFKRATKSRNSVMNVITRFMSGKRDVRNGKEIPKEDLRAGASVSNDALYGHLTFLDSNGVSKNISEDTVPVVSNGDGKRVLKLQLGFSSSSATPIKNGKIRYIIPKNHLNSDVKPSLSNSALASGSPKDLSDENNFIYEINLNTITGGTVGQINIEQQISSSIDKSPSAGDTTIARAEFYNGDELISTTTATAKYEYLSQILYKESDKKENKNLFDYVPGYYDRELIVGTKNSDGTFSPIKGNTFTLPFITYDRGKEFLQGTDVGDKNGNGRLTDVDYTITGIPEFLELVPTVETNHYWTLEGNVAKLNYDKTSVDAYKRPTRVGLNKGNNGPVFRVKEGYFDNPQKMEEYLSSNGGKKVDIEYKAIGHRPDGSTYTQVLATSEALNNQLKFLIGDDRPAPIPGERMATGVTTPNKQRLFSNQSDTDEFNVHYAYNPGPLRDKNGALTPRALKGNGDKLDNNYFVYSVPTDKPNTYFTHFQLTETHANVIQKDGTTKLEYYNNSETSKQSFNYTFAKPFKLYGVKADGTREELKEMSTANQLYEEVEIDKSKQFTRLVLEHPDIADKFIEAGDNYVPLGFRSTVRTTMANWQEMAADDSITRHENNIEVSLSTQGNSLEAATTMTYPATAKKNNYNTAVHTKERFTAGLGISPVLPFGATWGESYDANRGSNKDNITRNQIVPFMVRYTAPEYYNNAIKTVDGKKVLNSEDLDEKIQNATVMLVADSTLPLTNFRMPMDNKMFSNKFSTQGRANYSAGDYEEVVKDTEVINPDKIIKDYKGTGKTAYIFKAKDLGLKSVDLNLNQLNNDGPVALTFEVVNNGQAENGTYHIDSYLVWDKESQRLVGKDPSLSADILEGHEPGRQVVKATTDVTLKVASEYYTQLTIAKKNEVGVMGIINVKNGEDVVLNPSVVNAADAPAVLKEVMVEIPKNYAEPHKVAETSLKGPIPSTADYHVVYTTSKGTNAEKTTAQYVTADQITDWSTVTAVKYVFDREYILHKGEKFQTSFDVHVHEDNPNLVEGQSQVWLKDGRNSWLESNKVGLITEDQRGKLKVRHVNLSGNDIMSETADKGFQNDPYTTSSYGIIDRANDGKAYIYSNVHAESDATSGTYEKQQTKKVIYVYVEADRKEERKDVTRTINYVEKDNEGNVIFPQRTFTRPAKRVVYTIKEGPRTGEKIYGPWQRVYNSPLDWPTEVSPTGNNEYTLVGRKDDETIKNVEKEPTVTWKSTNEDIQVDPVTGKVTIAADKVKAGTGISVVTKDSNNTLTNVSSTDDAGNKVISPLASETTRLEITYIPKGQKEPITSIVTKEGNRWTTTDTNLTLNASSGEVTISKDKREFGQSVTTVAKDSNGNSTTLPAISNKKDAVIRPVTEAFTMDIIYTPAGQDTPVTVTLSREIIENKEYTVLYEARKGSININYEDTEGNVIKAKQAYVSEQKLKNATDVDGTELTGPNKSSFSMGALQGEKREKFRPDKITLEDGKIYNLRRVKPNTPRDYGNLVEGTTEITYVYELAKGTVRVKYQDTNGRGFGLADKVIKDNVPTGEAYDTTTSENKPTRYETNDGKIYELVTVAKTEGNVQYDANGVRTNVNQATKAEPTGTVAEGNKEITYIYELKKGSVVVHYIDTEGNKIKDDRTDKDNVTTGTQYNVTDATNKPAKITTSEGKIFELVTEAKTEGEVQYDATGLKNDSAAVTGRVKAETLEVTYVYKEKKSGVTVKYVDSQGRPIAGTATMPGDTTEIVTADGLKPVTDASIKSDYDVTSKKATKITTEDGKVYRLIADRNGLQAGSKPATGKVEENEIIVTYQYELLGSVVTKYELSDGTKLTGALTFDDATTPTTVEEKGLAVANATDVSNGTNYDAGTSVNKPNKITTATGEVYYLITSNNGVKADSASVTGTVEEGKTKEVTYVYEKAGSVVIKYINTDGTEIKKSVQDSTNVKVGTAYNATENDEKPATIEFNNKKYKLVTKEGTTTTNATYSVEAVVTNGENVGAATGQVVSGKTLEVTYVYEEVKGNVLVKYVDETGAPLAGIATMPGDTTETVTAAGVTAVTEAELGTSYDNKVAEKKATKITTAVGKVYELVAENNGLYNTSEPETGTVTEADKVVTFVYKEKKSAVNVKYVDKNGQPLAGTATMPGDTTETVTTDGLKPVTNVSVNSDYNVADKKASKITTADGKVYRLITEREGLLDGSKPVSGKVEENEITVTYQYELVNGNVTVSYKDTEGNTIEGYETPKDAEKDAPTGKDFNTATEALKPTKITTPSGKVYNLVPARTEGNESGKVTEEPQDVTYVYELAKGDVTVSYKDTEGNKIPGYETPKNVETQSPTGKEYTTVTEALKPTKITTTDGKVYNLVPTRTEGNENGKVTEEPQNVTYVYELAKGNVTVTYKDTEGNTIEGYETPKDAEKDAPTGKDFNTATEALKPTKITTPSGKVYNLVPTRTEGNENGKVTETPQNVTYVYELAKGNVTVTYKDTEGNKIPGYETPKNVETQSPTGKEYTTVTEALKPTKITTTDGKVYNLVPTRTEGNENGKVTEEPQNVTYVYELAKGNVTVTYKDTEGVIQLKDMKHQKMQKKMHQQEKTSIQQQKR
ncbi:MucBP domain-containing protein [Gemella haemolysans]|uniref:MucBP domain-containing protein n=2 Tax=Gemella haemolysans TaxID=1379 RepID=UPI000F703B04|nr:MucBP domain-containing protein [Gemella haemolysans]VEI38461.1 gram-positive signal peptide, YSIRK family [Gemella haemolysans]